MFLPIYLVKSIDHALRHKEDYLCSSFKLIVLSDPLFESPTDIQMQYVHRFESAIDKINLPERFTFPFYYDPHPLSIIAAKELQNHLQNQKVWKHDFGIDQPLEGGGIGKMFGVLVVEDQDGKLGYLSAFSGKLANANDHPGFVPPIYDMLQPDGFFNQGMIKLNKINAEVVALEKNQEYIDAINTFDKLESEIILILKEEKVKLKQAKKNRKSRRQEAEKVIGDEDFEALARQLSNESLEGRREFKAIAKYWEIRLFYAQLDVDRFADRITALKRSRKAISNNLQDQLFDQYNFLNRAGTKKNVRDIFKETALLIPPSGAGDCAAPKLFQFAFQNNLKPIAMAEFWWGKSPKSEIRKHGHFYPSCRGKCEPILGHMLQGMTMDPNPMLVNPAVSKTIDILYEDEVMAVVNKPADMLSVPGKTIKDSVAQRMKERFPNATGPLIVHRLDMSTSGLIVIAKSLEVHKALQRQFIERTVKKRYVAVLAGHIDFVCSEHGKTAKTQWEVIDRTPERTRVYFYPITGRTHQLRVHAAHPQGLNTSIVGDDLYGQKGRRLHLHAEWIQITHPVSQEVLEVCVEPDF